MSLAPVNDQALSAMFFSAFACMERQTALPVEVVQIVEDDAFNLRRRWRGSEDQMLLAFWREGMPSRIMGKRLNRSAEACRTRIKVLKEREQDVAV